MVLAILEAALEPIVARIEELSFADFLKEARDAVGLKQYRAAEFVGICSGRLKNLETGYFRDMPTVDELNALAALYDVDVGILYEKAKEHVQKRRKERKVRTIQDSRHLQRVSA